MSDRTVTKGFPSPVYGIEKNLLYDLLKATTPEQVVTYERMTKVCGLDVRGMYRNTILYAVLKRLEREQVASFDVVRGIGYVRLADDEIVGSSTTKVHRLRRAGRRIKTQLAVAQYSKLSPNAQVAYSVNMAIAHIVSEGTKAKTRKNLEAAAVKANGPVLPLTDTLALLAG